MTLKRCTLCDSDLEDDDSCLSIFCLQDRLAAETTRADRYKAALESIVGQTSDQFYEGVWREVNYTAQAALEDKP